MGSSPSKKPVLHKKERPTKYEEKLKVDMTFDELLEVVVSVDPREEVKGKRERKTK
jgi:hypothetical protein